MTLVPGIVLTVIGVILYAVAGMLPPVATKFARIGGIILAVIGIILIIWWAVSSALFIGVSPI